MSNGTAAISQRAESMADRMSRRLAGFVRSLRDNGFKAGLAETRDALAVLAGPAAARPSLLKPALRCLFCATRSDWERFDEVFDAYWHRHGVRQTRILSGAMTEARSPLRRLADAPQSQPSPPEPVESKSEGEVAGSANDRSANGRGRRRRLAL